MNTTRDPVLHGAPHLEDIENKIETDEDFENQEEDIENKPVDKQDTAATSPGSDEGDKGEFFDEKAPARKCGSNPESCGRGVVKDVRKTVFPYWWSQMTNLNQKTIAVGFFMFFAAVAPAITFGAVYANATNNYFGAVEMLLSSAWCGIVYALIGGQPIGINGGTGPVLAFVAVMFNMAKSLGIPFLPFNAWVGIWVAIYMFLAAFFDWNRIIRYATRFTDDIFALLISSIFIIDACIALVNYFNADHKSHEQFEGNEDYVVTSSAFLSLVLALGTTLFAFCLRSFKFSSFCWSQRLRSSLFDFAVTISIITFTVIDRVVFDYVPTEQLNVPDTFAPTFVCCTEACENYWPDDCPEIPEPWGRRPWLVDLGDLNGKSWVPVMAAGPALLAFILVFLDNGITWHIINHPSHKISYGEAYNYDTAIMGIMVAINSIIGIPWLTGATIRSLNHYHALAEKDQNGNIVGVQETRLTALLVHILILCCLFVLEVIKLIPVPVLYGVFLFMGLAGLSTNQFWQRFLLFFQQPSRYPDYVFLKYCKIKRVHLYTFVQILSFGMLYAVKSIDVIAIAFPIVIFANIPIRSFVLPRFFTKDELIVLDGDDEEIEDFVAHQERTVKEVSLGSEDGDSSSNVDDEKMPFAEDDMIAENM